MQAHATYWRALVSEGKAVAAGPVSDPGGNFGIGILELPEGVDPLHLVEADPAISARAGFSFEVRPMMSALVRPYRG